MRGLNAQELYLLRTSLPGTPEHEDLTDPEAEMCDALVKRGLMHTWEDDQEVEWWETTPLGAMMLAIHQSLMI